MATAKTCFIHFNGENDDYLREINEKTYDNVINKRDDWLKLLEDEKSEAEAVKVAEKIAILDDQFNAGDVKLWYHINCYRKFTNKSKLERALNASKNRKRPNPYTEDNPTEQTCSRRKSSRLSSENISITAEKSHILPDLCLICQKKTLFYTDKASHKRKAQELSKSETLDGGSLREAAEFKNDESILLQIRGKDLVAIEAQYHKNCYKEYISCLSKETQNSEIHGSSNIDQYRTSFDVFANEVIENRMVKQHKVYTMTSLCEAFIKIIKRTQNLDASKYQTKRLKQRLLKHFPDLIFYKPPQKNTSELVFDGRVQGEVIFDQFESGNITSSQSSQSSQSEDEYERVAPTYYTKSVYHQIVTELLSTLKETEGVEGWPPLLHTFTAENYKLGIPPKLFNFLCLMLGLSDNFYSDDQGYLEIGEQLELKVLSLAYDLVYLQSKGKKQTYKSLSLATAVKQLSGSAKLLNLLNGYGHCCSSWTLLSFESAIAKVNVAENSDVPRNILPNKFTTLVFDNADFKEETLSGAGTTHVAHGICIQRKSENDPVSEKPSVQVSKKVRTVQISEEEIRPYYLGKKESPKLHNFIDKVDFDFDTTPIEEGFKKLDLSFALCKFVKSGSDSLLPSWTGFNVLRSKHVVDSQDLSSITYLPIINAPISEMSTINTILEKGLFFSEHLNLPGVVMVFDEAVYCKIQMVRWKNDLYRNRIVPRLGDFHMVMSFLSAIGKIFKDSGLQDLLIESDVVAAGSCKGVMSGKHYNRAVRSHKLMFEALHRTRFRAFLETLGPLEEASVLDTISSLVEYAEHEDYETFIESPEVSSIFERFDQFVEERRATSNLFNFWCIYLEMVELLLLHLRATRTGDWDLHLAAVKSMLPWFFVTDRVNYSRYGSCYWAEMSVLDNTHPDLAEEIKTNWTVRRQNEYHFTDSACDQTIEQTFNRSSKMKGGIVGFTKKAGSVLRWVLSQPERAWLTEAAEIFSGQKTRKRSQKSLNKSRIMKDEESVLTLIASMDRMIDPFSYETDVLVHLTSGAVADAKISDDMRKMKNLGIEKAKEFLKSRLFCKEPDIFSTITKSSIKSFSSIKKLERVKTSKGELVAVRNTKNLFAKLVLIAKSRDVDMRKVLRFPLRPYPLPFATIDGNLVKTPKSKLLELVESEVGEEALVSAVPHGAALIVDAMALLQTIKPSSKETFGSLSTKVFSAIMSNATSLRANRIDFVGDRYPSLSIKGLEREKRASTGSQIFQIINAEQPVPRQWKKFMSNGKNKEQLMSFLRTDWAAKNHREFKGRPVLITDDSSCFRLKPTSDKLIVEEVPELKSDHEEADTRLILHAKNASATYSDIVVRSPDTDVFVIALSASKMIQNSRIFFATGTSNKKRVLDVRTISDNLGAELTESLVGLHAFSGCDSVSSFFGKGKKKVLQAARKNVKHLETFSLLGKEFPLSDELLDRLESFVCHLYGNETVSSVNELRYILFCNGKYDEEALPPTKDVLRQHALRANFQAYIWRHAIIGVQNLPHFSTHGWIIKDEKLQIKWMENFVAPESILNMMNCKCKLPCDTKRCSCVKNGLKCTELCKCSNCLNKDSTDDDEEEEDDFDDTYDDASSDDEDDIDE